MEVSYPRYPINSPVEFHPYRLDRLGTGPSTRKALEGKAANRLEITLKGNATNTTKEVV